MLCSCLTSSFRYILSCSVLFSLCCRTCWGDCCWVRLCDWITRIKGTSTTLRICSFLG